MSCVMRPPKPKVESDIMLGWTKSTFDLMLSVQCITYNHVHFIEDALNSFLMQETNFPIEIIVYDDASTDGTRQVVEKYKKEYPNIIKTIFPDKNQLSLGRRPLSIIHGHAKGKYIAFCDGDDYWTDPQKLQKQVEFLESHPSYVITGHDACVVDEKGSKIKKSKLRDVYKRDYSAADLSKGNAGILTLSWVYRNIVDDFAIERNYVRNGDNFLVSILGAYGKSHYHQDIGPAVYRVHSGGIWSAAALKTRIDDNTNTFFWMSRYYERTGNAELSAVYRKRFNRNVLRNSSIGELLIATIFKLFFLSKLESLIRQTIGVDRLMKLKRAFRKLATK